MAQYRQAGAERFLVRIHHDPAAADLRLPHHKPARIRRSGKPHRGFSAATILALTLALALFVALLSSHIFSRHKETGGKSDAFDGGDGGNNVKTDLEFRPRSNRSSVYSKELKFGHGSGTSGRDSRYWDRDDRRRDQDYGEEKRGNVKKDQILGRESGAKGQLFAKDRQDRHDEKRGGSKNGGRLYNEARLAELDAYKKEYEASRTNNGDNGAKDVDPDDEYDDGFDVLDNHDDMKHDNGVHRDHGHDGGMVGVKKDAFLDAGEKGSTEVLGRIGRGNKLEQGHTSSSEKKSGSKRKPKHRKSSSSSCEIKFLNSTALLVEPVENKKFARFSLQYTDVEDRPSGSENWEPRFAGHQTLQEREESYYAHDQKINCGFVKGPHGSPSTGFDLSEDDVRYMSSCHIAVSSCIFGNSDRLRTPFGKTITRLSRKNVCFVMFVDESTLQTLLLEGENMDNMGFIGLWKIIVVKNLPYADMRRVGKIPKFLSHRLFPTARYSIWLDSKLRLQSDPYLILEYFLWRHGYEYAISNHYDRHCVWEEVMQNKKLNKYNHTIIDQQFEFYQSDGLKRFDPSDPSKLLPSHVPEGSFIVRAHTPMSNLFSCLWFNEVDRFTPRDQLSFAYTYLKLGRMNPGKPFHLSMFKDCERRSIAKLFHHRAEEKRNNPAQSTR
ncbi:uncharacterized protein [Elaeis guineensis]|uniref:Uncharacterized protein LOC105051773 n=1 Tax=Elaeis guineensis var. tenera TaxID=51953 RepID=A0A6I9RR34_ELAGV|nr:uncharacterized protein LOC105051773 [Elaeis guineensis]